MSVPKTNVCRSLLDDKKWQMQPLNIVLYNIIKIHLLYSHFVMCPLLDAPPTNQKKRSLNISFISVLGFSVSEMSFRDKTLIIMNTWLKFYNILKDRHSISVLKEGLMVKFGVNSILKMFKSFMSALLICSSSAL